MCPCKLKHLTLSIKGLIVLIRDKHSQILLGGVLAGGLFMIYIKPVRHTYCMLYKVQYITKDIKIY